MSALDRATSSLDGIGALITRARMLLRRIEIGSEAYSARTNTAREGV